MIERNTKGLLALLAVLLVLPAAAAAAPTEVTLRVEGASTTIFEGNVTTDGHVVTTQSGGSHKCDGTNNGANPSPGPTPTAALDDGSKLGGFTWDADWFDSFEDFLVKRVGPDSSTQSQFWGQFVNSQASQVGGCQQIVKAGDEVLWAFDAFSKQYVLRLSGPGSATTGQAVTVKVIDGASGAPQSGASVRGALTGADGTATLVFSDAGVYKLKAERADSVRSNALSLCVDPPGADPCTSSDRAAPTARINAPVYASADRSSRFDVSWQGDDGPDGTGVSSFDVEVRRLDVPDGPWRPLAGGTREVSWRYGGIPGASYEFRARARDRAANAGDYSTPARTTVPFDDLDRRVRLSEDWRTLKRTGAFLGTVARSTAEGAAASLRFSGRRVALIGRRLPRGGRLRVTVDGRSRVLRLRGTPVFRQELFVSAPLPAGSHLLRLTAIGGGPIELDAVAPLP